MRQHARTSVESRISLCFETESFIYGNFEYLPGTQSSNEFRNAKEQIIIMMKYIAGPRVPLTKGNIKSKIPVTEAHSS